MSPRTAWPDDHSAAGVIPPATGVAITASFTFDVPVRFEEDRLRIDLGTWAAGEMASVPLMEVRA